MKDQVFISYRRDGGEALAQLLHDKLVARGFSVFYDIESLKSGPFNKKLLKKIEECDDFLLVLPPQALDRCIYDEDWVRQEIRHAVKHKKNIIPILCRGFVFPPDLPEDIRVVSNMNGVAFETMEYLDARIGKIVSMLNSQPSGPAHQSKTQGRQLIRNACSMGSCDFSNPFPKDGTYSEVIDRDRYNVVYFHLTTAIFNESTIKSGMRIYDENNILVHESQDEIAWSREYTRLSRSWVIRGSDGSFVPAGIYRAEFWIEDSAVYEYYFKVVSKNAGALENTRQQPTKKEKQALRRKMDQDAGAVLKRQLERKLSYPKALLWFAVAYVGFMLAREGLADSMSLTGMAGLVVMVIGGLKLIGHTKRYVCNSWIGAVLLVVPFGGIYGLFLIFAAAVCLVKGPEWKQQLNKIIE